MVEQRDEHLPAKHANLKLSYRFEDRKIGVHQVGPVQKSGKLVYCGEVGINIQGEDHTFYVNVPHPLDQRQVRIINTGNSEQEIWWLTNPDHVVNLQLQLRRIKIHPMSSCVTILALNSHKIRVIPYTELLDEQGKPRPLKIRQDLAEGIEFQLDRMKQLEPKFIALNEKWLNQ